MTSQDCSFEIVDGAAIAKAVVLGTQDPGTHEFGDPPAPFVKGEEVSFMGKWPLESYLDNNKEIFTFTTALGVVVTGTLIGFTVDCKAAYMGLLGVPRIRIRMVTKVDEGVTAV
jgi:hypothetical protein